MIKQNKLHLFLLAGQSNMAGRGIVEPQESPTTHPRILMLNKASEWVPAKDPIHYDKEKEAGVGPGLTFATQLADQDESITIGLIPSACGGSSITKWCPGAYFEMTDSYPYDDAISRTQQALKSGSLKGILWHQGESDTSGGEDSTHYKERLSELITRFRNEFNAPECPFIIGQLGQFPEKPWSAGMQMVDQAHRELSQTIKNVSFVSSQALSCIGDKLHFNAKSQREFGSRYAKVYRELKPYSETADQNSEL